MSQDPPSTPHDAPAEEEAAERLPWTHPDWRPWRRTRAIGEGSSAAPSALPEARLPWTHPDWRPWAGDAAVDGQAGADRPDSAEVPEARVRLHWTHPDWRPWRRWAVVRPGGEERAEVDKAPVRGAPRVRLPWSHPEWRPWRRWATPTPEVLARFDPDARIEGWLHPDRVAWGRLAALLVALLLGPSGVLFADRLARRLRNPQLRAEQLVGIAEINLNLGRPEEAARALERAATLRPDDPRYDQMLGMVLLSLGETAAAEARLRAGLARAPDDFHLRVLLGKLLGSTGRLREAWEILGPIEDAIVSDEGAERGALVLLAGQAAASAGAAARAVALLRTASDLGRPTDQATALATLGALYAGAGQLDQARVFYRRAQELAPRADVALALAVLLVRLERLEEVADALRPALDIAGTRVQALELLGTVLVARGRAEEALALVERLVASPLEQLAGCRIRAAVATSRGDLAGAAAECARMVELAPSDLHAQLMRGRLELRLGRVDVSRAAFGAALNVAPGLEAAELGLLELDQRAGDWEAVLERADRLLAASGTRAAALGALTAAVAHHGPALDQVRRRLEALVDTAPQDVLLQLYLGVFRLLAGDRRGAEDLERLAREDGQDLVQAYALLAELEEGRTDALEALELLSEVVAADPRASGARLAMAIVYERFGRPDLASREVEAALVERPDLRAGHVLRARLALAVGDAARAVAALQAMPPTPETLSALAQLALRSEGPAAAARLLEDAVRLSPRDPALRARLGRVQALAGDDAAALESFAAARRLDLRLIDGHQHAALLLARGDHEAAYRALLEAERASGSSSLAGPLAAAAGLAGRPRDGLAALQRWPFRAELEGRVLEAVLAGLLGAPAPGARPDTVPAAVWAATDRGGGEALELLALAVLGWSEEVTRRCDAVAARQDATPVELWTATWAARTLPGASPVTRRRLLERLLALAPEETALRVELAGVLRGAGEGDAALRELRRAEADAPQHPDVHLLLAATLAALGRADEANAAYARAAAAGSAAAMNNLAYRLSASTEPPTRARALALARQAVSLEPERPEFLHTLGWLLASGGQADEAVAVLSRAVRLKPRSPTIRYHLAFAYDLVGDRARARSHARIALLSPEPFADRPAAERLAGP